MVPVFLQWVFVFDAKSQPKCHSHCSPRKETVWTIEFRGLCLRSLSLSHSLSLCVPGSVRCASGWLEYRCSLCVRHWAFQSIARTVELVLFFLFFFFFFYFERWRGWRGSGSNADWSLWRGWMREGLRKARGVLCAALRGWSVCIYWVVSNFAGCEVQMLYEFVDFALQVNTLSFETQAARSCAEMYQFNFRWRSSLCAFSCTKSTKCNSSLEHLHNSFLLKMTWWLSRTGVMRHKRVEPRLKMARFDGPMQLKPMRGL